MPPAEPLSRDEERTWAMLAHLSVLVNLITGLLGPVVALIIYLVYKDRSRYVAYQSLQSLVMQLILWIGGSIVAATLWTITGLLSMVCIGILLIPAAILVSCLPLIAIIYGIIAGIQTYEGKDFEYWLIGAWLRKTMAA
jgi:uncharacterized Tic20 family protein